MKKSIFSILMIAILAASLSACGMNIPGFQKDPPKGKDKTLSMQVLANLEYTSAYTASGKAQMKDGVYSEAAAPGSASQVKISMWNDRAVGDLNGDHNKDSAVILITNAGGSGTFYDLAVVINDKGTYKHVATANLGDRVKIKKLVIDGDLVKVTMLTQGPNDPMTSPTQQVTRTFKFEKNILTEVK
jgi:uncharacterized protein with FMN-binding domain